MNTESKEECIKISFRDTFSIRNFVFDPNFLIKVSTHQMLVGKPTPLNFWQVFGARYYQMKFVPRGNRTIVLEINLMIDNSIIKKL